MDKEYVAEEKEDVPEANYLEENHPQGDHRV